VIGAAAGTARRRLLVVLGLAAVGAVAVAPALLAIGFVVLFWPAILVGEGAAYVGHEAACLFSGCQGPGGSSAAWDVPAVKAVTVTWLPLERQVVDRACAQSIRVGRPCVPLAFVQAIMMQESGGNPRAGSPTGALGLMQVEPSHFAPGQDPFDPLTNLTVGVSFLNSLDATFSGNLPLVAAGYNAGPGAPEAWEATYGTSDWAVLSTEPVVEAWGASQGITTAQYVDDVMAYYARFSALDGAPSG
jgi:hypothetical protein